MLYKYIYFTLLLIKKYNLALDILRFELFLFAKHKKTLCLNSYMSSNKWVVLEPDRTSDVLASAILVLVSNFPS